MNYDVSLRKRGFPILKIFHLEQLTAKAFTWLNPVHVSQVVLYLRRPEEKSLKEYERVWKSIKEYEKFERVQDFAMQI